MGQLFDEEKAKESAMGEDTKYSRAINVPQYTPSEKKPVLARVYDTTKYNKLIARINKSSVSDAEKAFLRFAAARHIVFNYAKIADYYAHSNEEMQELMEESALVILDIDDAIANGYVKLSAKMEELVDEAKAKSVEEIDEEEVVEEWSEDLDDEVSLTSTKSLWDDIAIKKEEPEEEKKEEKPKKKKTTKKKKDE